ncbi:hypothetical protein K7G98_13740 [Saccharothrix sp. MB29]|nr:hypothetical protein [Saccharothrix sp. MB29]
MVELGPHVPRRPRWRRPVSLVLTGVGYVLLVGAVVAIALAALVLRHSRRRSARDAVRALEADGRRPALHLRAFVDDHTSPPWTTCPRG